jgi:copper homeostasis protein
VAVAAAKLVTGRWEGADMPLTVEICVESPSDGVAAFQGGAGRIELCQNMAVGGTTPSAGAIATTCGQLEIPVHVLIRPRGGDFVYTSLELEEMRRDIEVARACGATGVVLGILDPERRIAVAEMESLVHTARPMSVTFHRAFDSVHDQDEEIEVLVKLGVERLLTSGRGRPAREDLSLLTRFVARARARLTIVAGGSIARADLADVAATGVREVHVGSSVRAEGRTSSALVRELVDSIRDLERKGLSGPQ